MKKTGFPAIVKGRHIRGDYEDGQYVENILSLLRIGSGRKGSYPFFLEVPTLNRPYFYRFFKPAGAMEVYRELGRSSLVFFESGYLMLLLSLAVVAISGTLAILLPSLLVLYTYSREKASGFRLLALGVLCGFGYTIVEMLLVGRASFFFDSYIEGFLVVVAVFLTSSGVGSIIGEKFVKGDGGTFLRISLVVVCLLFVVAVLPFLVEMGGHLSRWHEMVIFTALCVSISFFLGFYLPPVLARMQEEVGHQGLVALWGINNFSSLLGSLVTPVITVSFGFLTAFVGASLIYLLFAFLVKRRVA
jgi:hypothetical protein